MTTFGIIYEEPPQRCEQCDVIAETRPIWTQSRRSLF